MAHPDRAEWLARLTAFARLADLAGRVPLAETVRALAQHVRPGLLAEFTDRAEQLLGEPTADPLRALLDVLMRGSEIRLWTGPMGFVDRASIYTIAEEILIRREYHFRSAAEAPTVIDAGANIGMATYYAKRMCKAGKVICFEPDPDVFALLKGNIEASRFEEVELHQAALAATDGEMAFDSRPDAPLAGSLMPRAPTGAEVGQVVRTMRLRPFLDQPVGLLKLDIEGAEADVLEDCAEALGQVENVFCEVHPIPGAAPSLLARVLGVLEGAGFHVHVARSPWSERAHRRQPLMQADRMYSLSVYATRLMRE